MKAECRCGRWSRPVTNRTGPALDFPTRSGGRASSMSVPLERMSSARRRARRRRPGGGDSRKSSDTRGEPRGFGVMGSSFRVELEELEAVRAKLQALLQDHFQAPTSPLAPNMFHNNTAS